MMRLTKPQRVALHRLWMRAPQNLSYRAFRRTVRLYCRDNCVIVPWCGMFIGIETDGHTHS